MLKDYISKLPIETIKKIRIYDDKIVFPADIQPNKFYKGFTAEIKSNSFTDEKALFIASQYKQLPFIDASDLLNSKLRYT